MNKETYIHELSKQIKQIPKEEQVEILFDYEEHFDNARLDGLSDEEIIRKLGDCRTVGKEILFQHRVLQAKEYPSLRNLTKAVLAVMGLGIINLLFAAIPFILGLFILAGLFILSTYLLLSPILLLLQDGFTTIFVMELPTAIGLVGLGLLILLAGLKLSVLYYRGMIAYLNMNQKWVRGKLN